jgi:hypothetical protein
MKILNFEIIHVTWVLKGAITMIQLKKTGKLKGKRPAELQIPRFLKSV